MSRALGFFFLLGDAVSTIAAFLHSSGLLVGAVFAVFTSFALAILSSSIRSVLWPTYFWDQPEPVRAVAPHHASERQQVSQQGPR